MITNDIKEHNKVLDQVETLVDRYTLAGIVGLLAEIASEKADHLRANWQDEALAIAWDIASAKLMSTEFALNSILKQTINKGVNMDRKINLTEQEFQYIGELLAHRGLRIESAISCEQILGIQGSLDATKAEGMLIESLLSEKFTG